MIMMRDDGGLIPKKKTDWIRIGKAIFLVTVSVFVGYNYKSLIVDKSDAINTVVTIFSILAGFLIAVVTFVAEPVLKAASDYSDLEFMKKTVRRKMNRYKYLFYLYLVTLGLALVLFLVPENQKECREVAAGFFLGLAVFVFFASFSLPGSLMKMQMDKYEAELESRKTKSVKAIDQALAQ